MSNTHKIIIAGFGGQGVMLMGQLLAYASMIEGKEATWMPAYGPEMRGGTANCTVVISDKKIASPIVTQATAVVAMNGPSLAKFKGHLIPGKDLFINSSIIKEKIEIPDAKIHFVDCIGIATKLHNTRVANMVMLGAVNKVCGIASIGSVRAAMEKMLEGGKAGLIDVNIEAMTAWQ